MTLESLGDIVDTTKSKRSLLRAHQAFRISTLIKEKIDLEAVVIIRDRELILTVESAAMATRITFAISQLRSEIAEIIGDNRPVKIRLQK